MLRFIAGLFILGLIFFACSSESPSETTTTVNAPEEPVVAEPSVDTVAENSVVFDSTQYNFVDGVIDVDWKLLSNVTFEETYNEEMDAYIPYPKFKPIVQALDGKNILIRGYIIPTDETGSEEILVLSANPFSSCFFCGGAGPETVMDIKLKKKIGRIKQDQIATFKGELRLNDSDLYYLNYILEEAEILP